MSKEPTVVTDPQPNDVLFGKGSGLMFHLGNLRYRSLVDEHRDEYGQATHKTKKHVAEKIMGIILQEGGRFLKKMDGNGKDWVSAGERNALEKIKQSLREKRKKVVGGCGTKRKPSAVEDPRPPTKDAQPAHFSPRSVLSVQASQPISKVDEELVNCLLELPSMNTQFTLRDSTYAPLYGHPSSDHSTVSDKIRKKQEEVYLRNLHHQN